MRRKAYRVMGEVTEVNEINLCLFYSWHSLFRPFSFWTIVVLGFIVIVKTLEMQIETRKRMQCVVHCSAFPHGPSLHIYGMHAYGHWRWSCEKAKMDQFEQ